MRGHQGKNLLVLLSIACLSCGNTPSGDSDTSAGLCGNGLLDEGEECDPLLEEEQDCTTSCETAGIQTCSETCEWSECIAGEVCGNSVDEDCDGRTGDWEVVESESNLGVFRVEDAAFDGEGWNVVGTRAAGSTPEGWPVEAVHCKRISETGSSMTALLRVTEGLSQAEMWPAITGAPEGFGVAWTDVRIEEDGREGLAFARISSTLSSSV